MTEQFVKVGDFSSIPLGVSFGVPQDSVLYHKLFIVYINYIGCVSQLLKVVLIADGTNILYLAANMNSLNSVTNNELDKLYTGFIINKLSLNVSKQITYPLVITEYVVT